MEESKNQASGIFFDISENLAGIFRHMLPGVIVVGGARIAQPNWFDNLQYDSWPQLAILGLIVITVGNTWFALNRYGLHQIVDYFLYLIKSNGPARISGESYQFLDDLGKYTFKSMTSTEGSRRAGKHVSFRASSVLLILTLGEVLLLFVFFHSSGTFFAEYCCVLFWCGVIAILIGVWQLIITRHIDYYVVNPPNDK